MCPRLTEAHIHPNSRQKMRVRFATQLLSYLVYAGMFLRILFSSKNPNACLDNNITIPGMMTCIDNETLSPSAKSTAEFVQKMNALFDLLNSSSIFALPGKEAISCSNFREKLDLLDQFKRWIASWHFISTSQAKNSMPFQKGWITTIENVKLVVSQCLHNQFKYIGLRKLNQDCLEVSNIVYVLYYCIFMLSRLVFVDDILCRVICGCWSI